MKISYGLSIFMVFFVMSILSAGVNAARPSLTDIQAQIDLLKNEVQRQQDEIDLLDKQLEPPVEVVLPAVFRGRYEKDGRATVAGNIFVGTYDYLGQVVESRNFFVFDLSEVFNALQFPQDLNDFMRLKIVSAELHIYNPPGGFSSAVSDTETYVLNRVGMSFSGAGEPLIFKMINGVDGEEIFTDLADGPGYGSYVASEAQDDNLLVIGLSSQRVIHDLNIKMNGVTDGRPFPDPDSRLFAIGGSIGTLNGVTSTEGLFVGSTGATAASLVLKVKIEILP